MALAEEKRPKASCIYIRPDIDILHQAGVMDLRWGDTGTDILAHRESGVRIRTAQTFILQRARVYALP